MHGVDRVERMDIGFSCSVWASCEREGHLDGIGIYTRSLWQALTEITQGITPPVRLKPYAFGGDLPTLLCGKPQSLAETFRVQAVLSGVLNRPLPTSATIRNNVDIFHAPDHQIPQIKGVPVVASVMDLIPQLRPEWIRQDLRRTKSWLFTRSIHKADHLITISEHSKQDMVRHLGIRADRISVTPLGVDPVYFERVDALQRDSILEEYGLRPGFFLFIGTLQPRKNLPRILEAFEALPDAVRKEHPLIVVGRDGWNNADLLPKLAALEQRGEGRWLSYLPQPVVMALLQSAAALVFASQYEGFGLPAIEAFAAQCPLIASNTTCLPEVTGDAAWAVDPMDVADISRAMQDVLTHNELRELKIEMGLARAREYTWHACARKTLEVYEKVLASN
jgi:alpha-1,3-rhamnosyl/mannosyltransferase